MFGIFKNTKFKEAILSERGIELLDKAILKTKSTNEIIEEIHESFYTEVDKLLADSKILKSTDTKLQELIDKSSKLKALGFTNTKECRDAEIEINRLSLIQVENASKQSLNEAIDYFTAKYPLNKFITEESVVKICNKYGLVYGTIDRYLGIVPDKNLNEIANHKINDVDAAWIEETLQYSPFGERSNSKIISYEKAHPKKIESKDKCKDYLLNSSMYDKHITINKAPLEIAAPLKDFNMEGYELKGVKLSKIEIPDPVVLHPVQFKNKKYYLILSAWGLESTDELVLNNINN